MASLLCYSESENVFYMMWMNVFQRWNPVEGYTDMLLPTDRWPWTDEFGTQPQPLHSFHLPSENWEWEGDWYVDDESCGRESTATGVSGEINISKCIR